MLAIDRWRKWKPSDEKFEESPECEPSKPTELTFEGFEGSHLELSQKIAESTAPQPLYDPADWREAFSRWMTTDCIAHWRLHGGVGRLHVAFAEWEVTQGEVPCSRAVFETLLRERGCEIHPTLALIAGLMLRVDVDDLGPTYIGKRTLASVLLAHRGA